MGLNYVVLLGEAINSPEKRHTPDGQPVASFNMTFSSSHDETNEAKSGVIKVSALKKLADKCMNEVFQGSMVLVEGRLYTKTIENRLGQKQKIPFIQSSNLQVVKSKDVIFTSPQIFSEPSQELPHPNEDDEIPF